MAVVNINEHMTHHKSLVRSTAVINAGIISSRILGFVRDVLIARFFGTKLFADAFIVAFTIPNILRQLVAEGAVNTVMVPVLTECRDTYQKNEFLHFGRVLLNIFLAVLVVITLAGVLISPILVRIIAPGFAIDSQKFDLTVKLTRLLFPYILLVGLTAYFTGILHTFNHFLAPAFGTTVLNATIVFGVLLFYPHITVFHLSFAVLVGGVLQLLVHIPPMARIGRLFGPRDGFYHEQAGRIGKLLIPRMFGAGIYQLNIIVDRMLSSLQLIVGEGAVSALYYGNRIFQLPLALFGISLATAALPPMSSMAVKGDYEKMRETVSFSMRNMLFFSVPAMVGLMVMSRPIIKLIYERGEFTAYATEVTASALFFYAAGLAAYGGVKILVSAFYAMQDTVTPVRSAAVCFFVNLVLNILLMVPLKAGGLALATSISGFVNFYILSAALRQRIGAFSGEVLRSFARISLASSVMGVFCYFLTARSDWNMGAKDAAYLLFVICASILVYLAAAKALKIKEQMAFFPWTGKD